MKITPNDITNYSAGATIFSLAWPGMSFADKSYTDHKPLLSEIVVFLDKPYVLSGHGTGGVINL